MEKIQTKFIGRAFTLPEVLITLAIIGVVASLTIPTLVIKLGDKYASSKLKKHFAIGSQVAEKAAADNGLLTSWEIAVSNETSTINLHDKLTPYYKIAVDCKDDPDNTECTPYGVHTLNWTDWGWTFPGAVFYKIVLVDGSSVIFHPTGNCEDVTSACVDVYTDINGADGPNSIGDDIFYFSIYGNGKTGFFGEGLDPSDDSAGDRCNPIQQGWACSAWAYNFENRDYLRCPYELFWDGKHSCGL